MGQLGFFDLSRRYECLDAKNDPLMAIAALVPWECFRPKLRAALINGERRTSETARKSPAGRKPWDEVVIFKALVLQALYNLSEELQNGSKSATFAPPNSKQSVSPSGAPLADSS
jgi:IS5 family transposase